MTSEDRSKPRDDGLPSVESDSQKGFLGRWSRLKTIEQARPQNRALEDKDSVINPSSQSSEPAERHPTDADMPAIDALNESSDYSGFMSPKVSEELRRLALRKLFHLPEFNVRDGLDDYDEDFRSFEVLKDVITADMRHQMERKFEQDEDQRDPTHRKEQVHSTRTEQAEPQHNAIQEQPSIEGEADTAERLGKEERKSGPSSS